MSFAEIEELDPDTYRALVARYWEKAFHGEIQHARLVSAWVEKGKPIDFLMETRWMADKCAKEEDKEQWRRMSREEVEEEMRKAKARKAAESK